MEALDVFTPGHGSQITARLDTMVNEASAKRNVGRYSDRLKPSTVGDECAAKSWFEFHWVKVPTIDGETSRKFERGNDDEDKFIILLREMGFTVKDKDPERVAAGKTRKQFKFEILNGHMVGFADAFVSHPFITGGLEILFEAKSMNAKKWAQLDKKGLYMVDDRYYGQIQLYLRNFNKPWCLFAAINANDGKIYWECITPVESTTNMLMRKSESILQSRVRPARVAESPAFYKCKNGMCSFTEICHNGEKADMNCRSCSNCSPVDDGQFHCGHYNSIIPNREWLLRGCVNYKSIV